jgi:type IV secretion system protein VirD4
MNTQSTNKDVFLIALAGALPVAWLALLIAPYWNGSIFDLVSQMDAILEDPMHIQWTNCSLKAVLFCLCAYAMGIGVWLSMRRNYRHGEEHGSAKWGDAAAVNRKYRQKPDFMNKILTQGVRIGFDAHKHRRNLNVLVIGGSGAGKTRFYVKPNIMQANCSMVVLDPNGETNYSHFFITFFQRREMQ